MPVPKKINPNYVHGTIDAIESESIPKGAASSSKNWLTKGSHIELRRGYQKKGADISGLTDPVTGIHIGTTVKGIQVLFWSYLRKILYFDEGAATPAHTEIGSDLLPSGASGEDLAFDSYDSLAGAQVWISSPNSGYYKMMVNSGRTGSGKVAPAAKDNYDSAKNYKGYIKVALNRAFLWAREADKTGIYLSYIDSANTTAVSTEAIGSSGSTNYTGTLTAVTGKRTCYGVSFTDGSETFIDNFDGTLTGSAGGTGTIDYSSGVYDITFNVAAVGPVTSDYNWEDSTNQGIADFTFSGTRLASEGQVFRQDDKGSQIQAILSYKNTEYCLHKLLTYALTLGLDDTTATNLIHRIKEGIPNWRAAAATSSGIYFVDDTDDNNPRIRLMSYDVGGQEVISLPLSESIKLEDYLFDKCAVIEWNDFVIFSCRRKTSTYNDRMIVLNRLWKSWDLLDYFGNCFANYNGKLIAGDSLSPNALELFSGFDDDGSLIDNQWTGKLDDLEVRELKKTKEYWLRGLIQRDQKLDVYFSIDRGNFIYAGTVDGDGEYVDKGQGVSIGAVTVGGDEIGGGSAGSTAYPYFRRIKIRQLLGKWERIKVKYVATGLGYVSVSEEEHHDIHRLGQRIPPKYATSNT